jgi:hypothetical protein
MISDIASFHPSLLNGYTKLVHKPLFSALLLKNSNKKQEIKSCFLKLCSEFYHQGTYLPFTGVSVCPEMSHFTVNQGTRKILPKA